MSFLPTLATFSISATTFSCVGTYGTSGSFSSGLSCATVAGVDRQAPRARTRARATRTRWSRMSGFSFGQGQARRARGQHTHADQRAEAGVGQAGVHEIAAGRTERQRRQRIERNAEGPRPVG